MNFEDTGWTLAPRPPAVSSENLFWLPKTGFSKVAIHMSRLHIHPERHLVSRIGWLRAAVLGANDGMAKIRAKAMGVIRPITAMPATAPSPNFRNGARDISRTDWRGDIGRQRDA